MDDERVIRLPKGHSSRPTVFNCKRPTQQPRERKKSKRINQKGRRTTTTKRGEEWKVKTDPGKQLFSLSNWCLLDCYFFVPLNKNTFRYTTDSIVHLPSVCPGSVKWKKTAQDTKKKEIVCHQKYRTRKRNPRAVLEFHCRRVILHS